MLFGHHSIDKTMDEHVREIAALASDAQTLIFLDTNILSYLYKLHEAARGEFFLWSDAVAAAGRLVIPAWAASEYLSRVTSKALETYTPKSKEPSQAKKALEDLHETASLFVDESLLRRIGFEDDRTAYLTGFRQAIDALDKYTRVFSQQFDPGVIHQQIVTHLSAAILDSDLASLCALATQEGNGRFEHRLPPSFRDGTKPENRLGDLIIWFEILEKSATSFPQFPKVLFITNDEKSDWVYAPKMRIQVVGGRRKSVGNTSPEIKLADPRLVAEFRRKVGHQDFVICSLATLVEGLSKGSAPQFAQLAAAIQINIEESAPELPAPASASTEPAPEVAIPPEAEAPVEPLPEVAPVQAPEPAAPRLQYDLEALQDGHYQADAPSEINSIIRALKSLNWYTQNPAISTIRTIRHEPFTPSAWFVLGRNIYQAACGNSQKAMEFMATLETQLRQFPAETAQHLLTGMLFEIYFDANGNFRDSAKFSYADKPLSVVTDAAYADALEFITFHLRDQRARLKFMPGEREPKTIHIVSAPIAEAGEGAVEGRTHELRSVILDGVELIRDIPEEGGDAWERMLDRSKFSQERIRAKVSEDLAIPRWALTNHFDPPVRGDAEFIVPEGRKLDPQLALQAV